MESITGDRYINFVLENIRDLKGVVEIKDYADNKIADIVERSIKKVLDELRQHQLADMGIECRSCKGGKGMWWFDRELYDEDESRGVYFELEGSLYDLFSESSPDNSPYLCAYVETEGIKKRDIKSYVRGQAERFQDKKLLRDSGVEIKELDFEDPYLLIYPLNREINSETIKDKETFKKGLKKAIVDFTNTVRQSVR